MKTVCFICLLLLGRILLPFPNQHLVHRIIINAHLSETQEKVIISEIEKLRGVVVVQVEGNTICVESNKETTAENLKEVVIKNGFYIENYVAYSSIDISCSKLK